MRRLRENSSVANPWRYTFGHSGNGMTPASARAEGFIRVHAHIGVTWCHRLSCSTGDEANQNRENERDKNHFVFLPALRTCQSPHPLTIGRHSGRPWGSVGSWGGRAQQGS
jgi:hypothetical protein